MTNQKQPQRNLEQIMLLADGRVCHLPEGFIEKPEMVGVIYVTPYPDDIRFRDSKYLVPYPKTAAESGKIPEGANAYAVLGDAWKVLLSSNFIDVSEILKSDGKYAVRFFKLKEKK